MTKFEPGQAVRTTRAFAKREGTPVVTGHYLWENGNKLTFRDRDGSQWSLYPDDVEPYDPKPEDMIWLGDLSGWMVHAHTDGLCSLVHRCGYEIDTNEALANLVLKASKHTCG